MTNLKQLYKENRKTFWRYMIMSFCVSIFTFSSMWLLVSKFSVHYMLAFLITGSIGWSGKYLLNKYWVFKNGNTD